MVAVRSMNCHDDGMTDPASPSPVSPLPDSQPMTVPWRRSLAARLRNYFLAGVLLTAPISITVYAAWLVVDYVDSAVTGMIPAAYNPNTYLPFAIPGLGIVVLVVTLTVVGFVTTNFLGRIMVRLGEGAVARMPFVRGIYSAVKQIFETLLSDKTTSYSEVVLIEFPRKDMWTLGLVIGKTYGEIEEKAGAELFNVYVPTTPNPTSGYLVFLPRRDMISIEMTVEECLKLLVSGGIVVPAAKAKAAPDPRLTRASNPRLTRP